MQRAIRFAFSEFLWSQEFDRLPIGVATHVKVGQVDLAGLASLRNVAHTAVCHDTAPSAHTSTDFTHQH